MVNIFPGRRYNDAPEEQEFVKGRTIFECSLCHKYFITQSELLSHLGVHTVNADGRCPQCQKSFAQDADLKMHLFGHSRNIIVPKDTVLEIENVQEGPSDLGSARQPQPPTSESDSQAEPSFAAVSENMAPPCMLSVVEADDSSEPLDRYHPAHELQLAARRDKQQVQISEVSFLVQDAADITGEEIKGVEPVALTKSQMELLGPEVSEGSEIIIIMPHDTAGLPALTHPEGDSQQSILTTVLSPDHQLKPSSPISNQADLAVSSVSKTPSEMVIIAQAVEKMDAEKRDQHRALLEFASSERNPPQIVVVEGINKKSALSSEHNMESVKESKTTSASIAFAKRTQNKQLEVTENINKEHPLPSRQAESTNQEAPAVRSRARLTCRHTATISQGNQTSPTAKLTKSSSTPGSQAKTSADVKEAAKGERRMTTRKRLSTAEHQESIAGPSKLAATVKDGEKSAHGRVLLGSAKAMDCGITDKADNTKPSVMITSSAKSEKGAEPTEIAFKKISHANNVHHDVKRENVQTAEEEGVRVTGKGEQSKRSRAAFIPKYEPIQTRKRARSQQYQDMIASLVQSSPRSRGPREPPVRPDTEQMPKAVPKSLLILDPNLLPRSARSKVAMMTSPGKSNEAQQVLVNVSSSQNISLTASVQLATASSLDAAEEENA